jgi:hypothetical protein
MRVHRWLGGLVGARRRSCKAERRSRKGRTRNTCGAFGARIAR